MADYLFDNLLPTCNTTVLAAAAAETHRPLTSLRHTDAAVHSLVLSRQ